MNKTFLTLIFTSALSLSAFSEQANAADYKIDTKGAHASINFKIKHLGYSWLTGRFDTFSGDFSYDKNNIAASKIEVNIDTTSVNSNHAERDKHLKGDDYLNVDKFSTAKFVSTSVTDKGQGNLDITGQLSLNGVTKKIVINATTTGEGTDPWGGYRVGFSGTTSIALKDFAIEKNLGPASTHVELSLFIEGIKQ